MLKLGGERTRGALPYNVTPEHTARAANILGPHKWLAVEQKVCLETDAARARALGRQELARYMVLDNYRNCWLSLGFTEADLASGGSDRFIDAMVLWGNAMTVKDKLRTHFAAGATQFVSNRCMRRVISPSVIESCSASRHLALRMRSISRNRRVLAIEMTGSLRGLGLV